MDKILQLVIVLMMFTFGVQAQISQQGVPYALQKNWSDSELPQKTFQSAELSALTNKKEKQRIQLANFGKVIPTKINLNSHGIWKQLPNGDRVWRMKITSKDALALSFYFDNFYLPTGASFFVYSEDKVEILGAFTPQNNKSNGKFATGIVRGETSILEYYEPKQVIGQGRINLSGVGHAYRFIPDRIRKDFGDADPCQVNTQCSEGTNWQDQINATVRILVVDNGQQAWCTGTMINNVKEDCKSYLLTAEHCGQTSTASDFTQWIFYFNYESPNCANPPSEGNLGNNALTGATLLAQSNDNGGDNGSDFMLLELSTSIPASYNAYYAGWNANNTASPSGVSIHHPDGDIKKISTYSTSLVSTSFGTTTPNTHWGATWVATTNGHGITEGGSSGSAIFDSNGRIVGTLTGGSSFCSNPTETDEYGKMSYHWASNGTAAVNQLKNWLDPDNTGTLILDGTYAPCSTPTREAINSTSIKLYPNPANELFTIDLTEIVIKGNIEVGIYDAVGRNITTFNSTQSQVQITTQDWANGLYLVVIRTDNQTYTSKLIFEK